MNTFLFINMVGMGILLFCTIWRAFSEWIAEYEIETDRIDP